MIRISGGILRGRGLQVAADSWIRPTMGRVREAVFSMLAPQLPGAVVLDLFAGCGLLGLEALSRGADTAFFVDLEPRAVQLIKKNVACCKMESHSTVWCGSAVQRSTLDAVKHHAGQYHGGKGFDLVFLDPPYRRALVAAALRSLDTVALLAPGAIVVAEQEVNAIVEPPACWHIKQDRRYGDTRIVFWQIGGDVAQYSSE